MDVHCLSQEHIQAQIDATEANIRRLTSQIEELHRARQKERRTLGKLWFMIVPVGKTPTELLVKIFALAVGPDHPVHQVLLLSQVCSSWRQIVIGSPKLWAIGVVDVQLDKRNKGNCYLDGLQTLLGRSAPLPISVLLRKSLNPHPSAPSITSVLRVLMPTAAR
ncbi:F-box domain-containing protein [Mycena venus]|uniref:F-box domain-containing protein n=1 Tax=Mycena venus TaxID=2733690 RepID=A0A8H6WS87_9AGAR|nr:F-box domain-containing protein [Mycena venus]